MKTRKRVSNRVVCGGLVVAWGLLAPLVALGATDPPAPPQDPNTVGVRVTKDQCLGLLAPHRPSDDVIFRPGVDARGNRVAPADLEDWSRWSGGVEESFVFYLSIDPFDRRGNSRLRRLDSPHLPLGALAYDARTGIMTLDGQPISGDQQADLVRACRAAGYTP